MCGLLVLVDISPFYALCNHQKVKVVKSLTNESINLSKTVNTLSFAPCVCSLFRGGGCWSPETFAVRFVELDEFGKRVLGPRSNTKSETWGLQTLFELLDPGIWPIGPSIFV